MNLSISDELELFSKELQRYMSPHALEQLARNVGFVKRKSKYRAQDLHWYSNEESNSNAIIIKHLSGNMHSRWVDFLTTDGEKV
ncbi:DUF1572 family protein [Bacillus mobilis]|uniref:DUF1572 family protein n=1 Tax=Bacillus mobilis TaxID=2026190 RepID=UPI0035DC94E4